MSQPVTISIASLNEVYTTVFLLKKQFDICFELNNPRIKSLLQDNSPLTGTDRAENIVSSLRLVDSNISNISDKLEQLTKFLTAQLEKATKTVGSTSASEDIEAKASRIRNAATNLKK